MEGTCRHGRERTLCTSRSTSTQRLWRWVISLSLSLPLYLIPHLTTTRQARHRRQKVDVVHWQRPICSAPTALDTTSFTASSMTLSLQLSQIYTVNQCITLRQQSTSVGNSELKDRRYIHLYRTKLKKTNMNRSPAVIIFDVGNGQRDVIFPYSMDFAIERWAKCDVRGLDPSLLGRS